MCVGLFPFDMRIKFDFGAAKILVIISKNKFEFRMNENLSPLSIIYFTKSSPESEYFLWVQRDEKWKEYRNVRKLKLPFPVAT